MLQINEETGMRHDARAAGPSFRAGDTVVVKLEIADPDFSDMCLDGWAGQIIDVSMRAGATLYLVQWSQNTLVRLPLNYRERCESKDMVFDRMWLCEDDLDALSARNDVRGR
jgi:hypothetical protein